MATTIKDVARLAGVSPSTVSRILSNKLTVKDETREKVLQAVKQLDYKPSMAARSLRNGESRLLGFIIPNIERPFYPQIMKSLEDLAYQQGYSIILCDASENIQKEKDFLEILDGMYVDGIVFLPATEESSHIEDFVGKIPILIINRNFDIGLSCVLVDDYIGGYEIGRYLTGLGHTRIACVIDDRKRNYNIERYDGFCRAMREKGIRDTEKYVVRDIHSPRDVPGRMRPLLELEDRPTAVFAFDDTLAYGVYQTAHEMGLRIPEDLSVVGYDDIENDIYMAPPLTSYHIPCEEINEIALRMLFDEIQEKNGPKGHAYKLRGRLNVRASAAPFHADR